MPQSLPATALCMILSIKYAKTLLRPTTVFRPPKERYFSCHARHMLHPINDVCIALQGPSI